VIGESLGGAIPRIEVIGDNSMKLTMEALFACNASVSGRENATDMSKVPSKLDTDSYEKILEGDYGSASHDGSNSTRCSSSKMDG
jgi:hypothetical protein